MKHQRDYIFASAVNMMSFFLLASLAVTTQASFAHSYANVYRWNTPEIRYQYNTLPTLPTLPTLTVVEEDGYAMNDKMARVPLVLVPSNKLKVVHGGAIYYQQTYQGLPAIRLVLARPMYVTQPTTMIDFPSSFTVLHDGYQVPVNIAAVLAPVYTVNAPQEVRVVYAVPTASYPTFQPIRPVQSTAAITSTYYPINQEYLPPTYSYQPPSNSYKPPTPTYKPPTPSYKPPTHPYKPQTDSYKPTNSYKPPTNAYIPPSNNYQPPSNSLTPPTNEYLPPSNNVRPAHRPSNQGSQSSFSSSQSSFSGPQSSFSSSQSSFSRPQSGFSGPQSGVSGGNQGSSTPDRPVVTILDFPDAVSSPGALFFQPPLDLDSELGNRAPPQGVIPAGIVQSTAPIPNLSLFINSKESDILQSLRDEAQKHRLSSANAYSSDYHQVIIN